MEQREDNSPRRVVVAIIGGGLVGSLCASFFAKRGHDVHLYEYREDIRQSSLTQGRSINLALSARGRAALREVGLEEAMIDHGIAMRSRLIHRTDGSTHPIPYDPRSNRCIYSVGRKHLNEVLLSAAEKYPNVKLHFNYKLVSANLDQGKMTFQVKTSKSRVAELEEASADLIVGADGAFSAVRRQMMKLPMFDFSQNYIEHGYLELCIPPDKNHGFAMRENHLHIWPRGTFMMIALPNQDRSWTVTLFMPFRDFALLDSAETLLAFFQRHFADAIPLIGERRLVADFFSRRPSPLVTVKCRPYHVGDRAVIIGDAAHAMVPFYGQGMNAGFEDCLILDALMTKHNEKLASVLQEFSMIRCKDAMAICDLAVYNYIEMRDLVNRKSFLLRKKLDTLLEWLMPNIWTPLYTSVTFSDVPYHQCMANKKWQDEVVGRCVIAASVLGALSATAAAYLGFNAADSLDCATDLWFLPWMTPAHSLHTSE